MTLRRLALVPFLALFVAAPVAANPLAGRADSIRKEATVSFTGQYEVACPLPLVRAAMIRPVMMGALWSAYMYGPAYQVTALNEPGAVHVKDPTGIVGEVRPLRPRGARLAYLADGKLDHWAVPLLNKGTAVFDIALAAKESSTQVTVTVSVKPDSRIAGAALWALSPIVKSRIKSRVTNNFHDAALILKKISTTPKDVAKRLKGDLRGEFERIFLPSSGP